MDIRNVGIALRLTIEEKTLFSKAARGKGLSVCAWARMRLIEVAHADARLAPPAAAASSLDDDEIT